jgi:hypothetical protein
LQVIFGDRLARQFVAKVDNDRVADEQNERQLVNLRAAAHDLAGAARRVMLLDHLHRELHVLLEPGRRAHREVLRIEFEAYVDDLEIRRQHESSLASAMR